MVTTMSLRKDFKREAKIRVGPKPKGVEIDVDENNHIVLKYDINDGAQQEWVYSCEELMDQRYKIWVQTYAQDIEDEYSQR
jgi:hypothetical protein